MLHQAPWQKRQANLAENHGHCEFLGALLAPLIATGLTDVGLAGLAGTSILGATVPEIAGGIIGGAGIGAATSGLTGGNPLLGALGGGLSGGVGAFGPAIGAATGIGTVGGDILAGVGGGVLSSEITGSSPLTGALMGGATGAISGILSPSTTTAGSTAGPTPGPLSGAAQTSVPSAGGGTATPTTAAALNDITGAQTGGLYTAPGSSTPTVGGTTGGPGSGGAVSAPASTPAPLSGTPTTGSTTTGGGGFLSNLFGGGGSTSYPGWAPGTGAGTGIYTNLATGVTSDVPGANIPAGMSTAATGSAGGGIVDSIKGDISKLISNPLALVSGGILASQLFGSKDTAADQALQQQAAGAASTAQMLQSPLRTGILPPGAQASLDLSRSNMEAEARSAYAGMGMGDSTGQADAMQAISERIAADKFGMENMLFAEAAPYAELASKDDIAILNQQRAEDQQFTGALMSFVAALAGSRSGTATTA